MNPKEFKQALENDDDIKLSSTISFNNSSIEWDKIDYNGILSGNGYSITNFQSEYSLINKLSGVVTDLTIRESEISKNETVGGICRVNKGLINNCEVRYNTIRGLETAGGICGFNRGVINQCTVRGNSIKSMKTAGGICGFNSGLIQNCTVRGEKDIQGTTVGGIVAYNIGYTKSKTLLPNYEYDETTMKQFEYQRKIESQKWNEYERYREETKTSDFLQNFEYDEGTIKNCTVRGYKNIQGECIGGICGSNDREIDDCTVRGEIEIQGDCMGGICGLNNTNGIIKNFSLKIDEPIAFQNDNKKETYTETNYINGKTQTQSKKEDRWWSWEDVYIVEVLFGVISAILLELFVSTSAAVVTLLISVTLPILLGGVAIIGAILFGVLTLVIFTPIICIVELITIFFEKLFDLYKRMKVNV